MKHNVIILMGSNKDLEFSEKIAEALRSMGLDSQFRVASAHKTPGKILSVLKEHENSDVVYITVAGRANALSAFVDANTSKPVIACPPYSERFAGNDIYSSLRNPSGVASLVILEPEGAALAAAKIFALADREMAKRVTDYQLEKRQEIESADRSVSKMK